METQHDVSPSNEFASSNLMDSFSVKDQSPFEDETPLPIINVYEGWQLLIMSIFFMLNYIGICNFSLLIFPFEQIIVKLTSF